MFKKQLTHRHTTTNRTHTHVNDWALQPVTCIGLLQVKVSIIQTEIESTTSRSVA